MTGDLTNIYDICHPSPPSLKQLASISLALELWCYEINKYRESNTLDKLNLNRKISSSVLKPLLPSAVFNDIDEWTKTVGVSINDWLEHRCKALLDFHRDDPNEILHDFDDFVCDFDGAIDLSGTDAKRMMLCDRFSIDEKFKIACVHCLEDDVVRIWPSLSKKLSLDDVDFHKHAILFYWICRLTDQLHKIPRFSFDADDDSPEVKMLRHLGRLGCTNVEYFWHRLHPDHRWKGALNLARFNPLIFCRYVLAKLNETDLDKVMSIEGDSLLSEFLKLDKVQIILPTWTLMKHKLSSNDILGIARFIFKRETDNSIFFSKWDTSVSSGIWRSIPDNMKQHVIREVLPDGSIFKKDDNECGIYKFRIVSFLLEVLSDTRSEERTAFWHKNWRNLIVDCRPKDLSSLMKLCFNDENEITRFKETTLSKYENIGPQCSRLLKDGYFNELKDFVNFCCPTEQAGKNVKRNLLMGDLDLDSLIFHHAQSFDEFVKDAFSDNVEEIDNFKIKLVSSFDKIEIVNRVLCGGQYRSMMNFFDRFVVSRETPVYFSKRYFPLVFKNILDDCRLPLVIEGNDLSEFMQWCFENNERDIASFKKTLIMDELIPNIIRLEVFAPSDSNFRSKRRNVSIDRSCMIDKLDKLLEWYFDTPQDVENFKAKWADVFEQLF